MNLDDFSILDKYNFLKRYTPKNIKLLLENSVNQIVKLRKSVIRNSRLLSFYSSFEVKPKINIDKMNFANILQPEEVIPPLISPQLLQQSSNLFKFLTQNINEFAIAVINYCSKRGENYEYLTYHAIPCLFGYFSSREHMEIAQTFYVWVAQNADENSLTMIMEPFFMAAIFPFVEAIALPFLQRFSCETKFENLDEFVRRKTLELYINDLTALIVQSTSFLTHMHVIVLRIINDRWGGKFVCDFLFGDIFKKFMEHYLEVGSHSNLDKILCFILQNLTKSQININKIISALLSPKNSFQVPSLYTVFNNLYQEYILSIQDIQILVKVYKSYATFPKSLEKYNFENTLPTSLFTIRVYFNQKLKSTEKSSIIFSDLQIDIPVDHDFERVYLSYQVKAEQQSKYTYDYIKAHSKSKKFLDYALIRATKDLNYEAISFENFLNYLMYMKEIQHWNDILLEHQRVLFSPLSISLMEIKTNKIESTFLNTKKFFLNHSILQMQYISLIDYNSSSLFSSQKNNFASLRSFWSALIEKKQKEISILDIKFEHNSSHAVFYECIKRLSVIDNENLLSSYTILQKIVSDLNDLSKYEKSKYKFLKTIIYMVGSFSFINLYLTLNSLAFSKSSFRKLCTDEEIFNWVYFERVILEIVVENKALCALFLKMQSTLTDHI